MTILTVPHIKQSGETTCGAAALCMVYLFYGLKNQREDKIWLRLKGKSTLDPARQIIWTRDLVKDVEHKGLHYVWGQIDWNDEKAILTFLATFIKIGAPIIVCQRFKMNKQTGHFRIVRGMENNDILLNDPELTGPSRMSKQEFVSLWEPSGGGEVVGGEFLVVLNGKQIKRLKVLKIFNLYQTDIKRYKIIKI